ncbi:MAG: signal recognition particle protein [Candidatus Melainabacteria bacterium]
MFDQLSERLQGVFSGLRGSKTITDDNMEEALREVRRALLEADVSLRVIKAFIDRVKDRAVGEAVLKNLNPGQQLVKIVHDELVRLLGAEHAPLTFQGKPGDPMVIVLFGLQGSGKTTTAAKLALHLRKKKHNPALVAADVYRPAAIQQLMVLGKQIDVPVFTVEQSADVLGIVQDGLNRARTDGHDVLIVDTAGRLQVDQDMMAELLLVERSLKAQVNALEKLLVIDAMTGQEAVNVAEAFNTQMAVTGLVMTKMDGDARGGAALSVVEITQCPIRFVGSSEKLSGLEVFHPDRLATRILGMGDVLTLVERAQEAVDLEEAKAMEEKVRKQTFSLEDFMKIQKQMKMLGSLDQILGMLPIPGLSKEMREMISHGGESHFKRIEIMINSMTPEERRQPEVIQESRRRRIATGAGVAENDVAEFLKQFEQMKFMMKQFTRMSDDVKKEQAPGGLSMPRSLRKKMGGKPGKNPMADLQKKMPGGFPKGMMKDGKLPEGFPGGLPGNFPGFPGGFGK